MQFKNSFEKFGAVTKTLHWLVFILITLQLYLIWMFENISQDDPTRPAYMFYHKSVGATILFLTLIWIIWRKINVLPAPMPKANSWQHHLAKFVHIALFTGLILMPLSGLFMGMAAGRDLNYFNLFTISPFSFVPQTEALTHQLKFTHEVIATALIVLVILHVIGALVHHFIYKDNVLRRMLPW